MHIISVTDFPLFCSNSAWKCLILLEECSPQKSLILFEILPAEFIQAYLMLRFVPSLTSHNTGVVSFGYLWYTSCIQQREHSASCQSIFIPYPVFPSGIPPNLSLYPRKAIFPKLNPNNRSCPSQFFPFTVVQATQILASFCIDIDIQKLLKSHTGTRPTKVCKLVLAN